MESEDAPCRDVPFGGSHINGGRGSAAGAGAGMTRAAHPRGQGWSAGGTRRASGETFNYRSVSGVQAGRGGGRGAGCTRAV